MNGVILKDVNIPPSADEFAEEYSGMTVTSVIDLFSGYDQIPLDVYSLLLYIFTLWKFVLSALFFLVPN